MILRQSTRVSGSRFYMWCRENIKTHSKDFYLLGFNGFTVKTWYIKSLQSVVHLHSFHILSVVIQRRCTSQDVIKAQHLLHCLAAYSFLTTVISLWSFIRVRGVYCTSRRPLTPTIAASPRRVPTWHPPPRSWDREARGGGTDSSLRKSSRLPRKTQWPSLAAAVCHRVPAIR